MLTCSRLVLLLHIEMPPLKKRPGLAGTIISTAINAALIGSAVGLTVYRLWRNDSIPVPTTDDSPPPPPYDDPSHHALLPPPPKKPRQHPRSPHHRQKKTHRHRTHPVSDPESLFEREPQTVQVDDKMDCIRDKLGILIEQGKRALNTHVVVSSDAIEDEVDDGSDAWEEEIPRSVRHCRRPKTLNLGPASIPSAYSSLPPSQSTTSLNNITIEDLSTFQSPELRESMERARQRLMPRRLARNDCP